MESDFDPETADIIAWGISPDGNTPGTVIYWLTRGAKNLERIEVPATAKWGVVRDGHTVAVAVGEPGSKSVEMNLIKTFATHGFADEFAARLREALNNPCEWIAERWDWSSGHTHGKADPLLVIPTDHPATNDALATNAVLATKYRQLQRGEVVDGNILITKDWLDTTSDLEQRYASLRGGKTVDGQTLVDVTEYDDLVTRSGHLQALLNGNDVDGKRLLPVSYVQRMARLSDALGSALATINDHAWGDDIAHLGFQLERTY